MATANTLKAIVTYYERVSRDAGIKPQEVKASAKRIADGTNLMPNTVSAALKEEELGFIKTEEGKWKIGKVYDWVDFKKTFDANLPEVTKFMVWRQFPDAKSAPVGIKPDSSEVEAKKCNKDHVPEWIKPLKLNEIDSNRLERSEKIYISNREREVSGELPDTYHLGSAIRQIAKNYDDKIPLTTNVPFEMLTGTLALTLALYWKESNA